MSLLVAQHLGGRVPTNSASPLVGGGMFIQVHAVEWVFFYSKSTGIARNVLTAIACHCDPNGYCWPSFDRIAKMANTSRPSVAKAIEDLEALGEIETDHSPGRSTNRYFLPGFAATVNNSKEEAPQQESNSKPTVKSESVSNGNKRHLSSLIREEENNKEESNTESCQEVFKVLKRYYRQQTGKGLKSLGRYAEDFEALVHRKSGDVVLESFKLWLSENKEFAKECNWPMAAFMKNGSEHVEAYEDQRAGVDARLSEENEENEFPSARSEGT